MSFSLQSTFIFWNIVFSEKTIYQTYKIIPTKNHVKLPDFHQSYYQIFIVRLRFSVRLLKKFVVWQLQFVLILKKLVLLLSRIKVVLKPYQSRIKAVSKPSH